ncbi:hypothetical protein CCHR01_12357 [Colletotrichum chrysophilum]|uniref:NACHT-NTPase and P-loop NTPases N-terminal domain-containing protein n=1 Tax=Colletotrichum chrysophilum TaxID=1836956 RepID=A0AAD9EBG9_9PEZI|nr:hypothetical protein CCHR01_12357 [Colletotrichum chrysophilum]
MESTDIIASIIASVETISLSYGRFHRIEGFPRAFTEVAHALLLVEEILPLLQQGIKSQSSHWHNDDFIVKSLNDGLSECLELASSMCSIIRDITAVQDSGINKWSGIIHSYRQKVASIGKGHNIETLMLNLLVGLRKVFLNDSITKDFALPEQDAKLENAYKSLTGALSSLQASDTAQPSTTRSGFPRVSAASTSSVFSRPSVASSVFSRGSAASTSSSFSRASATSSSFYKRLTTRLERNKHQFATGSTAAMPPIINPTEEKPEAGELVENRESQKPPERDQIEAMNTIEEKSEVGEVAENDEVPQPSEKYLIEKHKSTELLSAARRGNEGVVRALLEKNDVNSDYDDGKRLAPQLWAANKRRETINRPPEKMVRVIEPKDKAGRTPLSWAAGGGHLRIVRILLYHGIDAETSDHMFRTPLSWAARGGHMDVVHILLDSGCNIESWDAAGRTPLSWAAGKGHLTVVGALLDCGSQTESWDNTGRTPLSWAAGEGHIDVIKLLLERGSDIESWDNNGRKPLSWAVIKSHTEIMSHLIRAGASVDSVDNDGRTLLSWAAEQGQEVAVIQLLDAGADAKSKDSTGFTPLSWAAEKGHLEVVQRLLLVEDLKVSDEVVEEAGWLPRHEDGSPTTADTQSLLSELDVNLHQPFCAHKLRKKESESTMHQSSDLRAQHLCRVDMQNHLSRLCGLAGVFPPERNPSSAFGWISFLTQETSIFFSKPNGDMKKSRVPKGFILQLHQAASGLVSAAICLQQSGFCCNQFTVLTASQYESGQCVIGMKTIVFDRLLELEASIAALRYEGLSDSIISRCVSICMHILENLFDISLPMPSTSGLKLHYCSLAVQLLCLGLVLYSRAHVGTFHPVYLAKPLNDIILCGSSSDHLQIAAEQHELSCMGDMVGEKVFAFRLISQTPPTEKKQSPAYLSATCEEIVDSWGPGSLLFADPEGLSEDRIFGLVIRGGIIEYHGRLSNGDRLFHWGEELVNTDPTSSVVFGYRDRIVIGADLGATEGSAVTVVHRMKPESQINAPQDDQQESEESANENIHERQNQPPSLYRSVNVNDTCKRDTLETWRASQGYRAMMGTEPSVWKFVERSFVLQFGDKVLGQVGANQTKQPGVSAKQAVLDRWTNEGNLLLLEELYGLQVSLCTGVARRVPLRVIVCDDLIDYIGGLKIPGWKELEGQARRAMMSKESFCEWDSKLTPDSESRKCMVKVVDKLLRRLRDTGFDKNGIRFVLLWPNKSEAHHCVRLAPEGDQAWCRMLKDKEWSTTFAVATNLCLEASSYKCRDGQTVWGGMKTLSTFMFYSEPGGSSTICAKTWQINDDRWYWSGETGGKVMFLARKKPEKVAELDFYRRRLNVLPKRLWSFIPSPEVLVEITSMEDSGEEVLIACRS